MVKECTHGFPTPAACWECMLDGPVSPPKKRFKAVMWMNAARRESECGRCGEWIRVGEEIGKVPTYGWCCNDCCEP